MGSKPFENAYELLTSIQGFDSFSLGPSSTPDEIARAFQTQSLIWHPDKNPGDPQALRIYKRMSRAYNTLRNPATRAAHDARLAGGGDANEDGYVEVEAERPVAAAEEPLPEKQPAPENLGSPPPSAKPFAYVDKEPGAQTPAAKAGLRRGDAILRIGEAAHLRDVQEQLQSNLYQPVPALVIDLKGRFMKKWVVPRSWDPWAPASLLGCQMSDQCPLDLQSYHPAVLAERNRRSAATHHLEEDVERGMDGRMTDEEDEEDEDDEMGGDPPQSSRVMRPPPPPCWARCLLALFSLLGLVLGSCLLLYPAYHYHIPQFWSLPFHECDQLPVAAADSSSPPSSPPSRALRGLAAAVEANFSFDAMRDGVKAILVASAVMMSISALGLSLACCRPSRTRGLLTAIYLCCGLPSWVLLVFVSVLAFRSRDEAKQLVEAYWQCMRQGAEQVHGGSIEDTQGSIDQFFHTAEMGGAFCITYAVALMLGMLCACRAIGWHAVARSAVSWISVGTGLLGGAVLGIGIILQAQTAMAKIYFDATLMGLGSVVMLVSLIGACGSRRESRCLLRTYTFTLTLTLLSLLGIALYLLIAGPTRVTEWVEANWGTVQENLPPNLSISKPQFMSLVETNQVALLTLTGLLVLVLGLDLIMACILLASVAKNGRLYSADLEMEPLKSTKRSKQSKKGGSKRSTTRKR